MSAFLVGASSIYDSMYKLCHRYDVLHSLFWAMQPHTAISVVSLACLLTSKAAPKVNPAKLAPVLQRKQA